MIRLLVTLLVPIAAWAAGFVRLPGLDIPLPRGADATALSIVTLGLTPALSGFIAVELIAAAVPRWRRLRTGGPLERLKLRRAALLLTLVLALVQAWFLSRWVLGNPWLQLEVSPFLLTATMVGGTCFLLALAWLGDRWGLTGGFSMLLMLPAAQLVWDLRKLRPSEDLPPLDLVLFGSVLVGYVGATLMIFRRPSRLRLPLCGLVPLPVAHGFFLLAAWAGRYVAFSLPSESSLPGAALFVALVALQAFAYSRRFARPAARFGITGVEARSSVFYAVFMSFPLLMVLRIPLAVDAFVVATAVAVILDVVAELRARAKEPTLVDVWPIHDVATLTPALEALEKAGIFAHPRAVHHRSLLQLFGPFVPIDVYVPAARAAEAQELLARILLESDAAEDAASFDERGLDSAAKGKRDDAIACFTRSSELAPRWHVPWFHLGQLYKKERNWQEAFRCFDEAADRLKKTEGEDALWDLGIAATAIGEWRVARAAWSLYGLADIAEDSDEPLKMDLGAVGVRVGDELVRCRQIDPARAVVTHAGAGRSVDDVLLLDGVEHGKQTVEGEEVPIYDELMRLK